MAGGSVSISKTQSQDRCSGKMLGWILALALLLQLTDRIQHAHATVTNLSPQNNSVTGQLAGAVNSTVFECDTFHQYRNGELSQISTTWMLQNFRSTSGNEGILVTQLAFVGVFLIGGSPRPPGGFAILGETYRNRIKVLNFTEDFDGAVLVCGSEDEGSGYFNLRVYRAPRLEADLMREVVEGRAFSLEISSGPEPYPYPRDFQWTKDGVPLRNSSRVTWNYPSVVFRNVSRTDSGRYALNAVNYRLDNPSEEIGRARGTFQLNVLYGPDIVRGPTEVVRVEGGEAVLVCGENLRSNPQASVVWSNNLGNTVDSGSARISATSSPASISLSLNDLDEGDSGNWTCRLVVENVGSLLVSITLTVIGPPSQPRHVTVISSGATWSHLSWEEPSLPGFPSSSSKLFVVVATRRTDGLVHKSLPTAGLSANITGLLPNSDYELTVLAQSVLGGVVANSSPSDLAFATTTTTVPDILCDDAPLSEQGGMTVTWRYLHTGGLNLSSISLLYAINKPHPQFQLLSEVPIPREGTLDGSNGPFIFPVQDLPAGNSYTFKITSSNDIGNSSTTCPPVAHSTGIPQKPELLRASPPSSGSVIIEVATNESGTEPPDLFQFNILAQHVITLEDREFEVVARQYRDGEVAELKLSGFVKVPEGSVYLISVSCTNRFGMSEFSDAQTVTIQFGTDGPLLPIVGSVAAVLVVLMVIVAVILGITLGCIFLRKKREREKRRYSPARHTEDNPPSTQNGGMNHISVSELSTPISNKKGSHPMSPQYDIIPTDIANHTIYDSLAAPSSFYPAPPPSLPPPNSSMSSLVKPSLLDSAHTSMGHLSEASSNMLRLKMKGSNPNVNTELTDMRESRRRSSSVPDMLDQTIDYPIDFLEPISINRDLLELEEGCGSERLARRCNGHLVGFDQTSLGLRSDV